MSSLSRCAAPLLAAALFGVFASAAASRVPEWEGPTAITGLTIVPRPGEKLEGGTIVIENGRIVAVGRDVAIPAGAREIDGSGLFAYAGFIDAFSRAGVPESKSTEELERRVEDEFPSQSDGPLPRTVEANRKGIAARVRVEDLLSVGEETFDANRRVGFTTAVVAPPRSLLAGRVSVVQLGDKPLRRSLLASDLALAASFDPPTDRVIRLRGNYPQTALGVMAHLRQTLLDAAWFRDLRQYAARRPEAAAEVPFDPDLEALQPVIAGDQPVWWEAQRADEIGRALDLSAEFGLKPLIVGGRQAFKLTERLRAGNIPVIVSLKTREKIREYKLEPAKLAKKADDLTAYGKDWDDRPFLPQRAYADETRKRDEEIGCAKVLQAAGITWCVGTYEMRRPREALTGLRAMIESGLPADAALAALTTTPARLLKLEREIGSVAPGLRGNLTIMTRAFDDKDARVRWVFVDGKQYEFDAPGRGGRGRERRGGDDEQKDEPNAEAPAAGVAGTTPEKPAAAAAAPESADAENAPAAPPSARDAIAQHEPTWPVETEADRNPGVKTGGSVLLKNALVLTVSGADLPNTSVLIEQGKIRAIGRDLAAPPGVPVLDLSGYVMMPGIVDPHAHIALDAVNEFTGSVVPEVRCEDVVRHDDDAIFRAAAGGCTTIHAMHGSANTIGGQNVVLKMKYGRPAAELIVRERQRTVKWALGENVKRSGMPSRDFRDREGPPRPRRFPGTRMGVEATMRRALFEGRKYAEAWAAFEAASRAGQDVRPPRRDLRLEALADILAGDIWVNCHCYRADEILRLMEVAEEYGIRVAVLHHVLEGYRIMQEILRHGAGTATFSDWWAYKIEAYDAVPHNAGMMLRAGINSTLKSDSADLMRHMNLEAAKCMKYSGLTPNDALRMITLNCAKLFGLEGRLGSIDVGKDGDVAVFDGHPLDSFSKCVLTIIEGEVYFRHRDFPLEGTKPPARPVKEFVAAAGDVSIAAAAGVRPDGTNGHPAATHGAAGTNGQAGGEAADPRRRPGSYAIVNGTVHPVSGPPIRNGVVLMQDGRITGVGTGLSVPGDAEIVDATGHHVYPGLINGATAVGLYEIGQVEVTVDTSEAGVFQPDIQAVSAFNPHSAMLEVTRNEGITTVLLVPDAPTIAGQAGLLNLDGWTMNEALIAPQVGLLVNFVSNSPKPLAEEDEETRRRRMMQDEPEADPVEKDIKRLHAFFRDAKQYAQAVRAAEQRGTKPPIAPDTRFEAMVPYALGEKPVLFVAESYKSILEVLMFSAELELRPIIVGGRDAWKAAELLAARNVPVIYDGVFDGPRGGDAWDANYRALSVLHAAGVKFCLAHRSADLAKLMPLEAGFAVAHGLDPDAALRAMTLSAAEILGFEQELGSLEVGKRANVIVTSDHPAQATALVRHVFIAGRPVSLDSKHTRDAEKFANRPAASLPPARTDLKGPPSQSPAQ